MDRARRHQTFLARLALGLLALVAELLGRSLTHRLDVGRHVAAPSYSGADYYPFLLLAVKAGLALMLARLAWRFVKARSVARAARRLLAAHGLGAAPVRPRVRLELSPRLWLGSFVATAGIFLAQMDAERIAVGNWHLFWPWVHTSALPVFAVLSVFVAVLYRAVARWFAEYEDYARKTAAHASRLARGEAPIAQPALCDEVPPRGLFGLAFESRPPPIPV